MNFNVRVLDAHGAPEVDIRLGWRRGSALRFIACLDSQVPGDARNVKRDTSDFSPGRRLVIVFNLVENTNRQILTTEMKLAVNFTAKSRKSLII